MERNVAYKLMSDVQSKTPQGGSVPQVSSALLQDRVTSGASMERTADPVSSLSLSPKVGILKKLGSVNTSSVEYRVEPGKGSGLERSSRGVTFTVEEDQGDTEIGMYITYRHNMQITNVMDNYNYYITSTECIYRQ